MKPKYKVLTNAQEPPKQDLTIVKKEEKPREFAFKCISCYELADVLFEGSSFCIPHYNRKLHTGR